MEENIRKGVGGESKELVGIGKDSIHLQFSLAPVE